MKKTLALTDNGHTWRFCGICTVMNCGHDYDPDKVRLLFKDAAAWARKNHLKLDEKTDHAAAYLDTIDKPGIEPVIPEYVKLYCAEKGGIVLADMPPPADRPIPEKKEALKPPPGWKPCPSGYRPSIAMRQ